MKMDVRIIAFLALGLAGTAVSLKCYTCSSTATAVAKGECGDHFEPKTDELLTTCNATAEEFFCRKEKTGVNSAWNRVTRSCARECETRNVAYIKRVTCCKTDMCNGAGAVTLGVMTMTFALMSAICF